eukprot:2652506-Rhodomonas_salina.3
MQTERQTDRQTDIQTAIDAATEMRRQRQRQRHRLVSSVALTSFCGTVHVGQRAGVCAAGLPAGTQAGAYLLCNPYATSCTDLAYAATRPYAPTTACPVLT